jgi:hypothetical protein
MIQDRLIDKMWDRVGSPILTALLIAMSAMLKVETPMFEKKKKVKRGHETSWSKIQLLVMNL